MITRFSTSHSMKTMPTTGILTIFVGAGHGNISFKISSNPVLMIVEICVIQQTEQTEKQRGMTLAKFVGYKKKM